ncbi:MAG: hypothetical protein COA42_10495 [Alteromonadaceae bacterium]|nr:MAG: hypothetical protein COA42_10495 [Alteromonadaceae bacterium]
MIIRPRRGNIPSVNIRKQKGVALILAIMIVALVTAISVDITWRFELTLARSANRWHGMQARAYIDGAEQLAKFALRADAEMDNSEDGTLADYFDEDWNQEQMFSTDEGGWISGNVDDALSLFNINSLMEQLPDPENKILGICDKYAPAHRRFIRLLRTVNLATGTISGAERDWLFRSEPRDKKIREPGDDGDDDEGSTSYYNANDEEYMTLDDAEALTEAVIDWLDADDDPTGFNGAEGEYYDRLDPPLTIANGPMASVSELQVIKGMIPEVYNALVDYIIALPPEPAGELGLNLNTLTYPVMRTIAPGPTCLEPMTIEDTDVLVDAVRRNAFIDMTEFKDDLDVKGLMAFSGTAPLEGEGEGDFKFRSNYFLLYSEAMVGEHLRKGSSLLFRQEDGDTYRVDTLRRTDAHF